MTTDGRGRALLIRHVEAGDRDRWSGDDSLRPLTPRGWRQAHALVDQLPEMTVVRILSSPYVRCVQTVEPLAAARGLTVEPTDDLAEGAGHGPLRRLLGEVGDAALCTHGDVLHDLLEWLDRHGVALDGGMAKGSTWVLDTIHGEVVAARHLPPPA